jgi:YVTN family beta-propeller protein
VGGASMTGRRLLLCLFMAIQFAGALLFGQETPFKALAFYSDKTEADHVQFALEAVKFLKNRAAEEHFTFEATTRWEDLNEERLKNVQLVIWLNESPTKPEQRSAFERYIQSGGAWLGFHAAAYNDQDTNWPWFVDFLGGAVFSINSWPPLPARLAIDDPVHAVMAGIPREFESPSNEWYVWKPSPRFNKDVRVLASLDPSNYPIGFKDVLTGGDLPVVWTNTIYKMLYMNMGHGDKIFTSPIQNQLIDNAVNWLGTGATQKTRFEGSGIRVSPYGIALNPQTEKFYAVNTMQGVVTVLDGVGHLLRRVQVGDEPEAIAINPDTNRVYVANSGSGTVSVMDGETDKVVATVPVGDLPYTIAVNRATDKVYVSRTFSDATVIIDGKTNAARSLKAGAGDAVAAESIDGNTYLISYEAPQVTVLSGTNDSISKIEAPNHLWAIKANPATKKVYAVSAGNSSVTVIDASLRATKTVTTGEIPCALAVESGSGRVFVANYASGNVTVIDGASDSVLVTIKVGAHPQAIDVDSSNHQVYVVSTQAGATTVVDGTNNSVLGTMKTGKGPFAIAVNPKSHTAVALGLDGGLTVIDGTTLAVSSPIPQSKP